MQEPRIGRQERQRWTKLLLDRTPSSLFTLSVRRRLKEGSKQFEQGNFISSIWQARSDNPKLKLKEIDSRKPRKSISLSQLLVMWSVLLSMESPLTFPIETQNLLDYSRTLLEETQKQQWLLQSPQLTTTMKRHWALFDTLIEPSRLKINRRLMKTPRMLYWDSMKKRSLNWETCSKKCRVEEWRIQSK